MLTDGEVVQLFKQDDYDFLLHGCNCQTKMGSGVALALATEFPQVREADLEFSKGTKPYERLGKFSLAETEFGIIVDDC